MPTAFDVLGPIRLLVDGRAVQLPPTQRRLLGILFLEPAAELDRERLAFRLWRDDPPPTARTAMQVHVSTLRKAAPALIATTAGGYALIRDGLEHDRWTFEALARRVQDSGRAVDWSSVLELSERALGLWRGAPFAELADDEVAAAEGDRLEELRTEVVRWRAQAFVGQGRFDDATAVLRAEVRRDPLREPTWALLMLALYRSGRTAEAARAYEIARSRLADEVGVEPGPELRELAERIRVHDPALGTPADDDRGPLPSSEGSFVGREDELVTLERLLRQHRVVTVLGPPGVGKSRLAIEAARLHGERERTPIWYVSLAGSREAADVTSSIATAMDTRFHAADLDEVADRAGRRRGLLVLDSCEHQVTACRRFLSRAVAAGELSVLLTSRRPVGFPSEHRLTIQPLGVPPRGAADAGLIRGSLAVRLFEDRARDADRAFRLTPANAVVVAEIARRTGGIPLAIEVVATWVSALGLTDIERMLSPDLQTRGSSRGGLAAYDSLQQAIDWSAELLAPADRQLLTAASAFRGPFAVADIRAVCAPTWDARLVASAIARTVDASLLAIERRPGGRVVYWMLDPLRESFRRRLADAERESVEERLVDHYLAKAEQLREDPHVSVVDLERVDDDIDNMRAAFEAGLSAGRGDDVARALVPLNGYFHNRYLGWEGRRWLSRALELARDPWARAHALRARSSLEHVTNDLDLAASDVAAAIRAFRRLGDRTGLTMCLISSAILHNDRGEWSLGVQAAERGRRLIGPDGSSSARGSAASYLGENLVNLGRVREGLASLAEAARHFSRSGELGRASHALSSLVNVAVLTGDEALARRHAASATRLARRSGSAYRTARALGAAAATEARWGDPSRACDLLLEARGLLGPDEGHIVYDFLFPVAQLLDRLGRTAEVVALLDAVDAMLAECGLPYAALWRDAADRWRSTAGGADGAAMDAAPDRISGTEGLLDQVGAILSGATWIRAPATGS